jgi:CTP-dependent riboflavin kinase
VGEVLSFLKETRGAVTWTAQEMIDALKLSRQDAEQFIAILQLQGYVTPALESQGWLTTVNGETVSGSKAPRFTLEKVNEALSALQKRIKTVN